jgi:type II secretory pathway component GspD/PulD (secretin)
MFLAALVVLTAAAAMTAQDRPTAEPKRGAYVVKYAAAKDLAGILAKHFKGAAEIQWGPEGTSNCLLVNAPPAGFDEVMKTLEQLDRRPQSVAIEVFVIELPAKKADDKDRRPDEKEFSGAIDDVATRLDVMLKKGEVARVKRVQLTTLEGQPGSLTLGESKAYVTGATVTATGLAMKQLTYRNIGTQVKVTALVGADRSIALDLNVQDQRSRESTTATVGKDEKGNAIPATDFIQTALTDRLSVASGKTTLAEGTRVTSKEGQGEMFIVVGARVIESGAAGK